MKKKLILKKKKVALFLNNNAGIDIFNYFIRLKSSKIICIYLTDRKSHASKFILEKISKQNIRIFFGKKVLENKSHLSWIKKQSIDFMITVYWPWLIKKNYLNTCKNSINFHPAYLPKNRGWYPHVNNILDNSVPGVTLHKIDEGIDTGPIWCQKKIPLKENETSYDLYIKLEEEIVKLFKSNWIKICNNKIKLKKQNNKIASYNSKFKLDTIDNLNINNKITIGEFIKILKARSFNNKGFAYYKKNGKKFYLNLRISENRSF